jgi:signal peptidase I
MTLLLSRILHHFTHLFTTITLPNINLLKYVIIFVTRMERIKSLWMNQTIRETIILILIAVVVNFGVRLAIRTFYISGPSMQPTFYDNELVIVNKLAFKFGEPQRGDIIVFTPPFTSSNGLIKRIIGLPGEAVEIENGHVYIYKTDGAVIALDEPYVVDFSTRSYIKQTVPENSYYVAGDHRVNSYDSRSGWFVPRENIVGQAWLIIWPPSTWGPAYNYSFENEATQ